MILICTLFSIFREKTERSNMIFFIKTMKFVVPAVSALVCSAVLAACGSDSSIKAPEEQSFNTFDDLPNCTKNREGETAFVEEDGLRYVCQEKKWTEMPDTLAEYDTEDDLPNCGSKVDGVKAYVKEDKTIYVCSDKSWNPYAVVYDTEDDLPNCGKKRNGEIAKLKDEDAFVICKDGSWAEYLEEEKEDNGDKSGDSDSGSNGNESTGDSSDSGSAKGDSSSSEFQWEEGGENSSTDDKTFKFEEGVLWKPSYGPRVHVFNDGLDESNFFTDESRTGKWFLNTDRTGDVPGVSTADTTYGKNYMTITHNLAYQNWSKKNGVIGPTPGPYAQALIYWSPKNTTADLSAYKGICLEYSSTKEFRLEFQSQGDGEDDFWDVWVPGGEHTVNLEFKNIPVAFWRSSNSVSIGQALKKMILMNIESPYIDNTQCYATNSNDCEDKTVTNTIKLYKIGEYGKCSGEAVELGKKRVVFEENVLWKSSYENKVRTYFGAVDEYNFMTDDASGWWFTYSDTSGTTDNGQSTVRKTFRSSGGYLEVNMNLVYDRWKKSGTSIVPSPYPYAAFGFDWASAGLNGFADLTQLGDGLCIDYTAEKGFDVIFYVFQDQDRWQYTVPASSVRKVVDIKFGDVKASGSDKGDFFRYDWQSGEGLPFKTVVKQVTGLHFETNGQHVGGLINWCTEDDLDAGVCEKQTVSNTIKLYKLGKYGACD
jgi:hypothetical protein